MLAEELLGERVGMFNIQKALLKLFDKETTPVAFFYAVNAWENNV